MREWKMLHKVSINFKSSNICSNPQASCSAVEGEVSSVRHESIGPRVQPPPLTPSRAGRGSGFNLEFPSPSTSPPLPPFLLLLLHGLSIFLILFSLSNLASQWTFLQLLTWVCPVALWLFADRVTLGRIQMSPAVFLVTCFPFSIQGNSRAFCN